MPPQARAVVNDIKPSPLRASNARGRRVLVCAAVSTQLHWLAKLPEEEPRSVPTLR